MAPKKNKAAKGGLSLPLLSPEEVARLTVPFAEIEAELRHTLDELGCAIVTGVASPEECARLERLFAEDLTDLIDSAAAKQAGGAVERAAGKVAAQEVCAFPLASGPLLGEKERCQLRGLPQGRFAWSARLLPNVRACYELIHGTHELVSSCDNSFFASPASEKQFENKSWPHVDHNSNDRRFCDDEGAFVGDWEVFQGLLYVWSSEGEHSSTTVVLPGSHLTAYEAMMQDPKMVERGSKGNHFSQISGLSQKQLVSSLEQAWSAGAGRVPVPSGGLLLWSSRALHQGWSGGPRLAQPVCWEPRGRRDDSALDRKLRLAALGLPSTHWGSLGIPHYLVCPQLSSAAAAVNQKREEDVQLPLKASIQLASLRPGVNVVDVWSRCKDDDWHSPLAADLREYLLGILTDDVLGAL
eukprot:TRINITY_DN97510_c0_g1_i1.p1 TRINITY_DN97510_c0_g1~~TRINITY_DN97510_c0_g1_i1.p1  ORF type:complete len:412 (-),score=72.55 TRINITY_DN97510_c0_g1_i1:37-1272(-)